MTLPVPAALLLPLLLAGAAPAAAPAAAVVVPVRVPGGVADAVGTVALLRTPEGGVEAVDAATGATLWRRPAPVRPLLAAEKVAYVLAQSGPRALQVEALDLRSGRLSAKWPLPAGALPPWAGLAEGSAERVITTVSVRARLAAATLEVGLDARQVRLGGMPLPPGPEAHALARVDLASGAVEVREGASLAAELLAVPAPPGAARLVRFHARAGDDRIMLGGPPPDVEGVLVSGDALVGFERGPGKVVVHRWSGATGTRAERVAISTDADAIWPTLDRRHVALRRAREQRRVDLYALEGSSETPIATLEGAIEIAVVAGRVYVTRRTEGEVVLSAEDPRAARTLWRRTIVPREGPLGTPIP